MPHRFHPAARWSAGVLFTPLCAAVAAYAFTFLHGQPQAGNTHRIDLVCLAGFMRLLTAPQFPSHRLGGGLYAGGVLIAGLGGLSLALHAEGGAPTRIAFALLALAWLVTTGIGIGHALAGHLAQHRQWMWRSIALTASAVTLRLILGIGLGVLHLPFPTIYLVAAWGCWLFNLAVCETVLRWPRRRPAEVLSAVQ